MKTYTPAQQETMRAMLVWRDIHKTRDTLIREAIHVGISKTDIAKCLGINRQTIYSIIARYR